MTVFGERNDYLGFQTKWAERLDDVEQITIPKGNHFPMCDAPTTVAAAILFEERGRGCGQSSTTPSMA